MANRWETYRSGNTVRIRRKKQPVAKKATETPEPTVVATATKAPEASKPKKEPAG